MDGLTIRGEWRGVQTYLDYEERNGILVPIDTKITVPGTDTGWVKNTIDSPFKDWAAYLFAKSPITVTGSPITSGALPRGSIYKVTTNTITQSTIVYPTNAIFVSDGTTVTWGTGQVTLCRHGYCTLSSLFDNDGTQAAIGAAQDGKDGIAHGVATDTGINYILCTTLNAGGTGSAGINYFEYYGYIDGAVTLNTYIQLGCRYDNANVEFISNLAYATISQSVAASRRYGHYWKVTIG